MNANKREGGTGKNGRTRSNNSGGNSDTAQTGSVGHYSPECRAIQEQAMIGVGGLARTLAHDIKNPLVSLRTFLQLYPTRRNDPVFCEKFVSVLGIEIANLEKLASQLGRVALHPSHAARVRLNPIVTAACNELNAESRMRGVEITVDEGEEAWVVVDAAAIRQALLNVGLNALEAAEMGMRSEKWVRISTTRAAEGVQISITDSGDGVPAELRDRLFQPFFSTKPHGFGLGLAVARQLLSDNRATIDINLSRTGTGATFRIVLPFAD
jgi:signal transduction histidine kinase